MTMVVFIWGYRYLHKARLGDDDAHPVSLCLGQSGVQMEICQSCQYMSNVHFFLNLLVLHMYMISLVYTDKFLKIYSELLWSQNESNLSLSNANSSRPVVLQLDIYRNPLSFKNIITFFCA